MKSYRWFKEGNLVHSITLRTAAAPSLRPAAAWDSLMPHRVRHERISHDWVPLSNPGQQYFAFGTCCRLSYMLLV